VEEWTSRAVTLPDSDRARRIAFVTALTNELLSKPYPPQFVIFAKGDAAEKMIIVGLYDNGYNTIYRARALLAELTALARLSPIFREYNVENIFTFFELLKLLGFEQLTVSDGDRFAHQVIIE
ncbi:MAG: molybdopterin-guanine dinucleotide biosynthesis protein A, partial [Geminicoccales bacterium]